MGSQLQDIIALEPEEQVEQLSELVKSRLEELNPSELVPVLVALLEKGAGSAEDRCVLARVLSVWGDPRLRVPADSDYWVSFEREDGRLLVGRDLVTNFEFDRFVAVGGYDNPEYWGPKGLLWLHSGASTWADRRATLESQDLTFANHPVVGVTWYEAEAYANFASGRLLDFDERLWVVRGEEKRPYPWGAPFRTGKSNTREEVLGHPCAVGLFLGDRTPEGVRDLAGNVAEWTADEVGEDRWVHPGSWAEPSMASWAKARANRSPGEFSHDLGFRISRDEPLA